MSGPEPRPSRRLSLSEIVEMLITRGTGERSSVTLSRGAGGDTHIEVKVRAGDDAGVVTAADAEARAVEIYERLRAAYPEAPVHDSASVALTRNAKGDTQIAVDGKTGPGRNRTVGDIAAVVAEAYDEAARRYPPPPPSAPKSAGGKS